MCQEKFTMGWEKFDYCQKKRNGFRCKGYMTVDSQDQDGEGATENVNRTEPGFMRFMCWCGVLSDSDGVMMSSFHHQEFST